MEDTVFKKMRLKVGIHGLALYAPKEFNEMIKRQKIIDFSKQEKYDFVLLFLKSQKEYHERITEALSNLHDKGILWIAYAKSKGNIKYDIHRDSLATLARIDLLEAVSNVALDETWSTLRFKIIPIQEDTQVRTIDEYLAKLPPIRKQRVHSLIDYMRVHLPNAIESLDFSEKLKFPTFKMNYSYICVASMKHNLTLHFSNPTAVEFLRLDHQELKILIGCVNIKDTDDFPIHDLKAAIDMNFHLEVIKCE